MLPPMRVEEIPGTRLTLCDDGVIETRATDTQVPRTPEFLTEAAAAVAAVGHGGRRPMLWDTAGILPPPPQGWHVIVNHVEPVVNALAILVEESDRQLLGAFPDAIDTLLVPVRIFSDAAEARDWLAVHVDPTLSTD